MDRITIKSQAKSDSSAIESLVKKISVLTDANLVVDGQIVSGNVFYIHVETDNTKGIDLIMNISVSGEMWTAEVQLPSNLVSHDQLQII